jgi:hypothetical protein
MSPQLDFGPPTDPDGVKAEVSERKARFAAEARRLGELYWILWPMCETNGSVEVLNERLARCRGWAKRRGVLEVLDTALREFRPEVV